MLIHSPYRITYTAGDTPPRILLLHGAVLASFTRDWTRTTQTDQALLSPWAVAADRGNASVTLSWQVLLCFPTIMQAQRCGHELEGWINEHPEGAILYETAFDQGLPMIAEGWDAVLQRGRHIPITPDDHAGTGPAGRAWISMDYSFLLTRRRSPIISA